VYAEVSRFDLAVKDCAKALELDPTSRGAYKNRAFALNKLGQRGELIDNWSEAVENIDDWPEALASLGWALATSADPVHRSGERAVAMARRACELTNFESPECLDALAAGYAETGRFDDAVRTMEKVLQLTGKREDAIVGQLRARLALYRTNRPYREPPAPSQK
jgi:tetratricopeptide (TPR) repeat protein